ncbi:MAG: hypothetical protein GQ527_05295 [Bacteroidales bacterium]|nr:hypothetical protein [Bacteroidales bacterium]
MKRLLLLSILFTIAFISCKKENTKDTELESPYGQFTDSRDGKIYRTVQIGYQVWMAENLNYETLNGSWEFTNNTNIETGYSKYYNWETASNVCPDGWHLPSDAEWSKLESYLIANGFNYDGSTTGNKIAKSIATSSAWNVNYEIGSVGSDQQSNNSSGFSALPGGYRDVDGTFIKSGGYAFFWSSTDINDYAWCRSLSFFNDGLSRFNERCDYGFNVRCIKD